jgi:hypothetical protein
LLSGFLLQAFPCTVVARWHNTCPKSVTSNILLADRKGWTMTRDRKFLLILSSCLSSMKLNLKLRP